MLTQKAASPGISHDARYDILKFILSVCVVAIHSNLFPLVLYPWLRLAVPLFFLISSYFLFSGIHRAPEEAPRLLRKFALRNARLYLFWFIVLLPETLRANRQVYLSPLGLVYLLRDLLLGNTFYASWYIAASVIGVYLVWFLCKKLGNKPVLVLTLGVFALLCLWSCHPDLLRRVPILSGLLRRYVDLFCDPLWSFPAGLIWIFLGKCFAEGRIRVPARLTVPLLVLSAGLLYVEWRFVRHLTGSFANDSYVFLLPVCLLIFAWLQQGRPQPLGWSPFLRRASTVVYTVHYSAIHALRDFVLIPRGLDRPVTVFWMALGVALLVWCILELLRSRCHGPVGKLLRWAC